MTNQISGTARGYLTGDEFEATNLPDELRTRGVTPETADHNQQISEVGFDMGGPILKDKLFFWGLSRGCVSVYIGYANPSSAAGWVEYPWVDLNGDHLAQTNEIRVDQPLLTSGAGFNPNNPTAVSSPNVIDPDFGAPVSTNVIIGFDRELMPNLAMQVNYTYGRVTNLPTAVNNTSEGPFLGLTTADWVATDSLVGTTPMGSRTTFRCSFPTRPRLPPWAADAT